MNIKRLRSTIASGEFLYNRKLAIALWFGLSLFAAIRVSVNNQFNNYLIYRSVFYHLLHHVNLYLEYPAEYNDVNLYGPIFGLLIAPFALLPDKIGVVLWVMANAAFLFYAISQLPLPFRWKTALIMLNAHELMFSAGWVQINALVCGCILLGFAFIQKEKEGAALFFILLATFIKVYGVVGFGFFFFSQHRWRFVLWTLIWSVVFILAPAVLCGFRFLFQSYGDWMAGLQRKAIKNNSVGVDNLFQNISVTGMIQRISGHPEFKDIWVFIPGSLLLLSQYLSFRYFKDLRFRLYLLASILLFTVIFSNGAETPTYIIALPGMCIWWLLQPKTKSVNLCFALLFIFATFGNTDVFGPWFRHHVMRPYALKALPATIIWIIILVQIHRRQFLKAINPLAEKAHFRVA